jgi:hypothetical protein
MKRVPFSLKVKDSKEIKKVDKDIKIKSTISVNASEKILLQAHSIKTIINLIIRCEEVLCISCEPVATKLSK